MRLCYCINIYVRCSLALLLWESLTLNVVQSCSGPQTQLSSSDMLDTLALASLTSLLLRVPLRGRG